MNGVTALVTDAGAIQERYVYDPYGKVTILDPDWSDDGDQISDVDNEILYCGYYRDPETGLYHVRWRMYHPTLGRWLQRDPLGYIDGMSLYEYVGSSPVKAVDYAGLWKVERDGATLATATAERRETRGAYGIIKGLPLQYDTIASLCYEIGLDLIRYNRWLTLVGGKIRTWEGDKTLQDLYADTVICPGQKVKIPNVVLAYWGGAFGGLGKFWVMWNWDVNTLKRRGFYVQEEEAWTAKQLEAYIGHAQADKILHGVLFWGHADKRVIGTDALKIYTREQKKYEMEYSKFLQHYMMPFGVLYGCNTASGRIWFSHVYGVFWGKEGLIWPLPFHLHGPPVAQLLKPGEQGTKR